MLKTEISIVIMSLTETSNLKKTIKVQVTTHRVVFHRKMRIYKFMSINVIYVNLNKQMNNVFGILPMIIIFKT